MLGGAQGCCLTVRIFGSYYLSASHLCDQKNSARTNHYAESVNDCHLKDKSHNSEASTLRQSPIISRDADGTRQRPISSEPNLAALHRLAVALLL